MTPEDITITIGITLVGIAATWFFARWYYNKGSKEVNKRLDGVEGLGCASLRINQDANPREGNLVEKDDGIYVPQFAHQIHENVTVGDKVTVIKNPGTRREEIV